MIISVDIEKVFDKIQHLFIMNELQNVGKKGTYLNIIKPTYDKPTANIKLKGEKLKAYHLRLAMATRKRKRNKENPNWKRSKTVLDY